MCRYFAYGNVVFWVAHNIRMMDNGGGDIYYEAAGATARCFLMPFALRVGRVGIGDGGEGLGVRFLFVFLPRFDNSSANSLFGLMDGEGLKSGCSSGSLDRSWTSGGKL
jgi:hypothetical protein